VQEGGEHLHSPPTLIRENGSRLIPRRILQRDYEELMKDSSRSSYFLANFALVTPNNMVQESSLFKRNQMAGPTLAEQFLAGFDALWIR